ncbi:MAG: general secretion pathway protein GspC [Deltaproteobacteria bacterium]|nr:general secretion pathway protein GspC [Deltaproteobacteria bacterium]
MELFFRKYFWVVNLLFLLVASYFAAKTANTFLGAAIAPKPDANPSAAAAPSALSSMVQKVALSAEAVSKVTGIELPKPEEIAAEDAAPALPDLDSQEPVKSGLRVRLLATTVSMNHPEWSIANIEDVTSHEANVYMVGDKLLTAEVLDIEFRRVIINNNGRKEYIDNEAGNGEGPVADAKPAIHATLAANTPPASGVGQGIKETGADSYEIPREEINKALGNLNDIAMQARIVPAFKDGVATGFKLFSIRPDSLYTKIGIQNGDIIRRINGFEINSPDKALEVYTKLKESNRIEIEVDRNGSPVRKTYNVK